MILKNFIFLNFYIFCGFSFDPINCGYIFPHLMNRLILPNYLGKYKFCHQMRHFIAETYPDKQKIKRDEILN